MPLIRPRRQLDICGVRPDKRDISLMPVKKSAGGGRWVRHKRLTMPDTVRPAGTAIGRDGRGGRDFSDVRCGASEREERGCR